MKKSAHYRQCQWLQDEALVLRRVLDETYDQIESEAGFADYDMGEGWRCIVKRSDFGRRQSFFHFVTYEQDSQAAVISVVDTDIDEVAPPENSEFIESQLFLMVRNDHALYATHNRSLRDGSINGLLMNYVAQAYGDGPETQFQLMPKFNEDELRRVFSQGIDHIDLGLGSFAQTIESLKQNGQIREGSVLGAIADFFREYNSPEDDRAAADIKNKLVLKAGRSWGTGRVREYLTGLAMTVTEEHTDEFTIVTKGGVRVTQDKITVKEEMEVGGNMRILRVGDVMAGLGAALRRLQENNILEQ